MSAAGFWRGRVVAVNGDALDVVVPRIAPKRVYRAVKRLEGVADWSAELNALAEADHPGVAVPPYAVGNEVLVAFVDGAPVILGRLV